MTAIKPDSHKEKPENNYRLDIAILEYLREEMLQGDLDYISLKDAYDQGKISFYTEYSWELFRRRSFYQIGLGYADYEVPKDSKVEKVDMRIDQESLYSMRITPKGFGQIEDLEKLIKKYTGLNRYITKSREFIEKVMGMRGGIIVGTTSFLIVCIFAFDIKVSEIINETPILSSVINTDILEQFEEINEEDGFYLAMMDEQFEEGNNGKTEGTATGAQPPYSPSIRKVNLKNGFIPKSLSNILPSQSKIQNIVVNKISDTEKLFKMTLDNGIIRYVQVKKENGKYVIEGKIRD